MAPGFTPTLSSLRGIFLAQLVQVVQSFFSFSNASVITYHWHVLLFLQDPSWEMFLACKFFHNNQWRWSIAIAWGSIPLCFCKICLRCASRDSMQHSIIPRSRIENALHLLGICKYEACASLRLVDGRHCPPVPQCWHGDVRPQELPAIFTSGRMLHVHLASWLYWRSSMSSHRQLASGLDIEKYGRKHRCP